MQYDNFDKNVKKLLHLLERFALIVIAGATLCAASYDLAKMIDVWKVSLGDLLLMFLYLEVLAMVSFTYTSGKLPVTYPLYIGMVALARYIVLDMKELDAMHMLATAAAILILAVAVLVVRFGHMRYPYPED